MTPHRQKQHAIHHSHPEHRTHNHRVQVIMYHLCSDRFPHIPTHHWVYPPKSTQGFTSETKFHAIHPLYIYLISYSKMLSTLSIFVYSKVHLLLFKAFFTPSIQTLFGFSLLRFQPSPDPNYFFHRSFSPHVQSMSGQTSPISLTDLLALPLF